MMFAEIIFVGRVTEIISLTERDTRCTHKFMGTE